MNNWMTDPNFLAWQALVGLTRGMGYFVAASGLTLVYGVLRILNFSHGSFYMVGAFVALTVVTMFVDTQLGFWIALIVAPIVVALLAGIIERQTLARLYRRNYTYQLLVTYGLILVLADLVRAIWGAENRSIKIPAQLSFGLPIGGRPFPAYYVFVIVFGALVALAIWLFLNRTKVGTVVRAAASDTETANALGRNIPRLYTGIFMLGGALAGLGGVLLAPIGVVGLGMDMDIVMFCFIVVIVGGLGSVWGALIAAIIIGEVFVFGILVLPDLAQAFLFLVMIIVLLVRPFGLMGRAIESEGQV